MSCYVSLVAFSLLYCSDCSFYVVCVGVCARVVSLLALSEFIKKVHRKHQLFL